MALINFKIMQEDLQYKSLMEDYKYLDFQINECIMGTRYTEHRLHKDITNQFKYTIFQEGFKEFIMKLFNKIGEIIRSVGERIKEIGRRLSGIFAKISINVQIKKMESFTGDYNTLIVDNQGIAIPPAAFTVFYKSTNAYFKAMDAAYKTVFPQATETYSKTAKTMLTKYKNAQPGSPVDTTAEDQALEKNRTDTDKKIIDLFKASFNGLIKPQPFENMAALRSALAELKSVENLESVKLVDKKKVPLNTFFQNKETFINVGKELVVAFNIQTLNSATYNYNLFSNRLATIQKGMKLDLENVVTKLTVEPTTTVANTAETKTEGWDTFLEAEEGEIKQSQNEVQGKLKDLLEFPNEVTTFSTTLFSVLNIFGDLVKKLNELFYFEVPQVQTPAPAENTKQTTQTQTSATPPTQQPAAPAAPATQSAT